MNIPKTNDMYRHYKGNEYKIICLAIDEATEAQVVVYQDIHMREKIWVRPLLVFLEEVEIDGVKRPRFEYSKV